MSEPTERDRERAQLLLDEADRDEARARHKCADDIAKRWKEKLDNATGRIESLETALRAFTEKHASHCRRWGDRAPCLCDGCALARPLLAPQGSPGESDETPGPRDFGRAQAEGPQEGDAGGSAASADSSAVAGSSPAPVSTLPTETEGEARRGWEAPEPKMARREAALMAAAKADSEAERPGKLEGEGNSYAEHYAFRRGFREGAEYEAAHLSTRTTPGPDAEPTFTLAEVESFVSSCMGIATNVKTWRRELRDLLDEVQDYVHRERAPVDQLRVQLAGCAVAAGGWAKGENDCAEGDYGWSPAFDDVKQLRAKYERVESALRERWVDEKVWGDTAWREWLSDLLAPELPAWVFLEHGAINCRDCGHDSGYGSGTPAEIREAVRRLPHDEGCPNRG